MIPYGRQDITQADIDVVVEVLRSDYLTQGPVVPRFEAAVRAYCGAGYALAMNSATSALHVACLALGLGSGDWLWTTPISFVASANCGLYCGANIDFVDIDPRTYNLCPQALERKLICAAEQGCLPKVLVAVHLCGQPCDMQTIHALSQRYGFRIIEDASHAIGGRYLDQPVGCGQFSDITIFSFHPVKIITTGEGGMALTNQEKLARKMALLRSHGITRDPEDMVHTPEGPWYYEQIELGFNYRMTDLQAALGVSQMTRLDEYLDRRHALARQYDEQLRDLPVTLPWQHPDGRSAFHLYVIRLQLPRIASSHKDVFEALRAAGIAVNLHYIPIYRQPHYQGLRTSAVTPLPHAEAYYAEAISLPMYPTLTTEQQIQVTHTLRRILSK